MNVPHFAEHLHYHMTCFEPGWTCDLSNLVQIGSTSFQATDYLRELGHRVVGLVSRERWC